MNVTTVMIGKTKYPIFTVDLLCFIEDRFDVIAALEPATDAILILDKRGIHKDTTEAVTLALESWDAALTAMWNEKRNGYLPPIEGFSSGAVK